jgi:hypothetical protein
MRVGRVHPEVSTEGARAEIGRGKSQGLRTKIRPAAGSGGELGVETGGTDPTDGAEGDRLPAGQSEHREVDPPSGVP